jgi:hypothetical protein
MRSQAARSVLEFSQPLVEVVGADHFDQMSTMDDSIGCGQSRSDSYLAPCSTTGSGCLRKDPSRVSSPSWVGVGCNVCGSQDAAAGLRRVGPYAGERQDARGEMAGGGSGALKTGRMQDIVHDGLEALVDGPYGEVAACLL